MKTYTSAQSEKVIASEQGFYLNRSEVKKEWVTSCFSWSLWRVSTWSEWNV